MIPPPALQNLYSYLEAKIWQLLPWAAGTCLPPGDSSFRSGLSWEYNVLFKPQLQRQPLYDWILGPHSVHLSQSLPQDR